MEATDLAEQLREDIDAGGALTSRDGFDGVETSAGFDEASFFVKPDGGGTFLVTVAKVAE